MRSIILFSIALITCIFLINYPGNAQSLEELQQKEDKFFSKCIAQKGITIYGATGCSKCDEQRMQFGSAIDDIKYINCENNIELCKELNITQFPAIRTDEGKRVLPGNIKELAAQVDCPTESPYSELIAKEQSKINNNMNKYFDTYDINEQYIKCLNQKGFVFYGTDWCPHCKQQKRQFGKYFKDINYVNCDKKKRLCLKKHITGYPTLLLGNGQEIFGHSIKELAEKAKCEIQ